LKPGEGTTVEFTQGGGCGEAPAHPAMHFLSSDTLVARVDATSGRVTAVSVGDATIWMNYADLVLSSTSFTASAVVHVQ
jgi:uncharacterized protein YjdB